MKRESIVNILLAVGTTALSLLVLIVFGRIVEYQFPASNAGDGLLMRPHSKRAHVTSEFETTITINNLGFRDSDMSPKSDGAFRVLAIGDSFTYGWGVDDDESWPNVLEEALRNDGYRIEIVNLGSPGSFPRKFTELAEKAVPLLAPDLIILAVLQGDDLSQSKRRSEPVADPSKEKKAAESGSETSRNNQSWLRNSIFPLLNWLLDARTNYETVVDLGTLHRQQYEKILKEATTAEQAELAGLDPGVAEAFHNGGLNPALVYRAIKEPRCLIEVSDPGAPTYGEYLENMAWEFRQIKTIADRIGAKVHVVSVPLGIYVSKQSYASRERIGFELLPEMLESDIGDTPIRKAAELAGLPFDSVTGKFREWCDDEVLYYEYDGHFNPLGQRRFAEAVHPHIEVYLPEP